MYVIFCTIFVLGIKLLFIFGCIYNTYSITNSYKQIWMVSCKNINIYHFSKTCRKTIDKTIGVFFKVKMIDESYHI